MMKSVNKPFFLTGATMLVVAAVLMMYGHVLGDSTTGFARVLLITGICFVGSSRRLWVLYRKLRDFRSRVLGGQRGVSSDTILLSSPN